MRSAPHIVVVGGGLAGLAAGVTCIDAGVEVTLLEARGRLGGAATSFRRDDLVVDTGQHVALRCCTAYLGFLDRLGTRDLIDVQPRLDIPLLAPNARRGHLRRTPALPAPLHLASSLLRFPYLPLTDRLRVAMAAIALAREDRSQRRLDGSTFADWLRRHGQDDLAIERFWDLVALPTLNARSGTASADLAAMVFQTGLLSDAAAGDIAVPRVPLADLHARPAATAIRAGGGRVLTGVRATSVAPTPDGWLVASRDEVLRADAVVVAVPHDRVSGLVPPDAVPDGLDRLGAAPIVNVHLHLDRRVLDVPFGAAVASPVQWVFDRTEVSGATEGQVLAISLSAAENDVERPTEELVARYVDELATLVPELSEARVLDAFVTRDRTATFHQGPGTAPLRPSQATSLPGLALAGAWTDTGWPATMEGAVRSGVAAAEAVLSAAPRRSRRGAVA